MTSYLVVHCCMSEPMSRANIPARMEQFRSIACICTARNYVCRDLPMSSKNMTGSWCQWNINTGGKVGGSTITFNCAPRRCVWKIVNQGSRLFPTGISSTLARANAYRLISHWYYPPGRWPQLIKHSRSLYSAHLHSRSKEKWRFVVVIVVWHPYAYPKK